MPAPSDSKIQRHLDQLADRVTEWDQALIRQAVLVMALHKGVVSANDFRDYLPETSQGAVGLTIRQLPTKKHGQLITKATTVDGYPMTVPSSAPSTHGKPLNLWRLTPAGRVAALCLVFGEEQVAA